MILFYKTGDEEWEPIAQSPDDPELMRKFNTADMNDLYDGVIEVVDRATGRVRSRLRSDAVLGTVIGSPALVYGKELLGTGQIDLHVLRLRVES